MLQWRYAVIPVSYDGDRLKDACREITDLRETIGELQQRIDKQAVLMRAFFALVADRVAISEADLLERFREFALEKAITPAKRCNQCGRTINLKYNKCYYCDEPHRVRSAFELLDAGAWPDLANESSGQGARPSQEYGITTKGADGSGITILPRDEG
jgi:hypothetical protein